MPPRDRHVGGDGSGAEAGARWLQPPPARAAVVRRDSMDLNKWWIGSRRRRVRAAPTLRSRQRARAACSTPVRGDALWISRFTHGSRRRRCHRGRWARRRSPQAGVAPSRPWARSSRLRSTRPRGRRRPSCALRAWPQSRLLRSARWSGRRRRSPAGVRKIASAAADFGGNRRPGSDAVVASASGARFEFRGVPDRGSTICSSPWDHVKPGDEGAGERPRRRGPGPGRGPASAGRDSACRWAGRRVWADPPFVQVHGMT